MFCGRLTARKPRTGKQHYPHKCSHGTWCVRGETAGLSQNHPLCKDCVPGWKEREPKLRKQANEVWIAKYGSLGPQAFATVKGAGRFFDTLNPREPDDE